MSYKLTQLEKVSERIGEVLKAAGITDTEQLLMAATGPGGLGALAAKTGLDTRTLGEIAERADLMRVKGVGPAYVELLQYAGIRSVTDLAGAGSSDLYNRIVKAAETYGIPRAPRAEDVAAWVADAKSEKDVHAWATGIRVSDLRNRFAEDEWTKIQLAPLAAAAYIMTASPSGATDLAAESAAAAGVVDAAKKNASAYSLFNVALPQGFDAVAFDRFLSETPRSAVISVVRAAYDVVASKNPGEADAFRQMLMDIGEQVANAAKEGGFLGIGGKVISDEEKAALTELRAALS